MNISNREYSMTHKNLTLLMAASALALSVGTAKADIQIATVGPITGPNAAYGEQFKRGAEQAVADINAKGGVLGQKLVLTIGDDVCDPKQAVTVANQMASKGIIFVAGHFCSGSSIPASAVYNDAGILQISPGSTNPKLTDDAAAKGWDNVYRVCGRDDQQGAIAGKYLIDHYKGKPIAVIDDKSAYGKGLADETTAVMNKGGLKEVIHESITTGDKDFSALISKMKAANVGVIYFGGYPTEAGLIVRQAAEQGLKAVLIGGDSLSTTDFWGITGPVGEGTLYTFAPDPEKKPGARAVLDEFKKGGYEPEGYTLYTYAAVQVFAEAAEKAKSTKLPDLVKALHSQAFPTVIGPVKFDAKGDITEGGFVVWKWHDGKYSELNG
jgi:branched-chain amino acid transport system substrate-binding protein